MKIIVFVVLAGLCVGCGEPEPRKPVSVKSGSFFKESILRNKKLLEQEEQRIREIIQKDTLHHYHAGSNGFWYYFETKNATASYLPQPGDHLLFSYTIMSLNNDTIYTADQIGSLSYRVDREQLFPGLQQALKLLKVKEKATFLFPSSQAYGYSGDGKAITPNTPLKASVLLYAIRRSQNNLIPKSELQ